MIPSDRRRDAFEDGWRFIAEAKMSLHYITNVSVILPEAVARALAVLYYYTGRGRPVDLFF